MVDIPTFSIGISLGFLIGLITREEIYKYFKRKEERMK
tara:strand:- start:127 stop:240 length:114 start_codon:yes stop_codon:yes gene_type:complete